MNNSRDYNLLKVEDFIWVIYVIIALANIYSNYMQEKNIEFPNTYNKNDIKKFNLTILITVFFIYVYFVVKSYNDVVYNYSNGKNYKAHISKLSLYASLLFVVAGLIFIYIEYKSGTDEDIAII